MFAKQCRGCRDLGLPCVKNAVEKQVIKKLKGPISVKKFGVLLRAAARSIYEKGGPSLQLLLPSCKDRTKAIVAAKTENHCQGFRPFRALFHQGFMGLLQKDEKQQLLGLLIICGRWPFCWPRVWSGSLTNPNPTDFFGGDPTCEKTGAVPDFAKIPLIRKRCLVFAHDFSH